MNNHGAVGGLSVTTRDAKRLRQFDAVRSQGTVLLLAPAAGVALETPVPMGCPFCRCGLVVVLAAADDLRSVTVRCPSCRKESCLAVPSIH